MAGIPSLSYMSSQANPAMSKRHAVAAAMIGTPGTGQSPSLGGQMPQDIGQGLAGLGDALHQRQMMRGQQFPGTPTGGAPQPFNFQNFMANRLGMNSGGLY